jgi:hypothetical protein
MVVLATVAGIATSTTARAQATIGAGDGKNTISVDFYKVPPGRQDDWLALYKKYHYPIMQYQRRMVRSLAKPSTRGRSTS